MKEKKISSITYPPTKEEKYLNRISLRARSYSVGLSRPPKAVAFHLATGLRPPTQRCAFSPEARPPNRKYKSLKNCTTAYQKI